MRPGTKVAFAILGGLACMPAGACSSPDREYDASGGTSSGGVIGKGGATNASGGTVITDGGATVQGGAGGAPEGGAPTGGASEGGAAGGVQGGAAGAEGGAAPSSGGSAGAGGAGGESGAPGGSCLVSGSKICFDDVPAVCSMAGVWVEQPACATAIKNASGPVCAKGTCDYASCNRYYQDCDTNRTNGCESNGNTDSLNCGGCGLNCATLAKNTISPVCNGAGACDYTACSGTFQDCDATRANGCESNKSTDVANCGSCGRNCATLIKGATPVCTANTCDYTTCNPGNLDCNGTRSDGCERPPTMGTAGNPTPFTAPNYTFSANYLLGHQITVPCSILNGWGVISRTVGQHLIMALYKDASGTPGALVAQSPVFTLANTTQTLPATSQVVLAAGTYWIMGLLDADASISKDFAATQDTKISYISLTYGSALPTTFPTTALTYTGERFNYFLNLQ